MQAQTLESLIARYRRSVSDPLLANADIELEVRFRGVDFYIFKTVLEALVAKKAEFIATDGEVTCAVHAIMDEDPALWPRRGGGTAGQKASLIRQIMFDDSGRKVGERYYRKRPLAQPHLVRNPHTLSYNVVLSAEETLSGAFTSDTGALIRVKCRASFKTVSRGAGAWRVDLTVTRTLHGTDAQAALPSTVKTMFRAGRMTPANMLTLLGLADPELRSLYGYELEIEHLAASQRRVEEADGVRPSDVTAVVAEILKLANPEYMVEAVYQAEIYHIAGFVVEAPGVLRRFEHEWGLKKLAPQVIALTRGEYKSIYPPTGYYLLDKADGVRALASVRDGHLLILADVLLEFHAPGRSGEPRLSSPTIVDGELVRPGGGQPPVYYAFDVLVVEGNNVAMQGYERRVERLEPAIGILRDFGLDARPKPIVHLTASEPGELRLQYLSPVFQHRDYQTDGRILVEPGKPYSLTNAYKWKPLWDTTIDFLARRAPASALGQPPYVDAPGCELHFLFVGINPDLFNALGLEWVPGYRDLFGDRANSGSYFPIQFAPSVTPLAFLYQHPVVGPAEAGWEGWVREIDEKIVELRCAGSDCASEGQPRWQLVRVREDRTREAKTRQYFGNDFRIAELTWLNYVDPFEENQLWEGPTLGYFAAPKSALYRAQTAFTSFIKSLRIESTYAHAAWVVDAAIGRGQDLGRYIRAGVRHVVGIDVDRGALSELVRRKFSHAKASSNGRRGRRHAGDPTTLFVLWADLTSPHEELSARVRSIVGFPADEGADGLVINLAIHYLAGDIVLLRNFIVLCRSLVKIGGVVTATLMIGQRVHDLFTARGIKTGESWNAHQDGVLKFSIRRDYVEAHLTAVGQQIGVLHPFSDGAYYEEYLVNVEALTAEFEARGFELVGAPAFDEAFNAFRARNPTMHKMLTKDDLEFLGLYGEIIFRRRE